MYEVVKHCKTPSEALARSRYFVGQQASVVALKVYGNTDGVWTIHPEFQVMEARGGSASAVQG